MEHQSQGLEFKTAMVQRNGARAYRSVEVVSGMIGSVLRAKRSRPNNPAPSLNRGALLSESADETNLIQSAAYRRHIPATVEK